MKVIKKGNGALVTKAQRDLANAGCDKCPCCGETKTVDEYYKEKIYNKGIDSCMSRIWEKGMFTKKRVRCDCYFCASCGAEWESDPYEI